MEIQLPVYPEGASRAAGKWPLPGRSGSTLRIDGKILSEFFPFRHFFHIFGDVANYSDLKQSRFGARINGNISQGEVSVLDSQKKIPNYQSIRIQSQPHPGVNQV